MPRPQDHRDGAEQIGDRGDEAGLRVGEAERLDDLRQPELHAVERADEAEIDQAQRDHLRRRQRLAERQMLRRLLGRDLRLRACAASQAFCSAGQPVGLLRPVGEIEPGDDAEQHRGDALDDEQPLPALQPHRAVEPEQQARDRRADHGGDGNGDGEGGEKARAIFRRIPIGQIENDAGEEAGFGDAEQEAQDVEAPARR